MLNEMTSPTPEMDPTLHTIPNAPMAEFEDSSATQASSATSSKTPSPSASPTSLASSLSMLTSVTGLFSSLTGFLGLA